MNNSSWAEPFETPGSQTLELMPFRIRYALDLCGVKLSLAQWQSLPLADRKNLLKVASQSSCDCPSFHNELLALAKYHAWELSASKKMVPGDLCTIPNSLQILLVSRHLKELSEPEWSELSIFERYVLTKISQGKRSLELEGALKSFRLL